MECGLCGRVGRSVVYLVESETSSDHAPVTTQNQPMGVGHATVKREKPGLVHQLNVQVIVHFQCLLY